MDFNSGVLVNGIDLGFINKMIDRVKENPEKGQRTYKAHRYGWAVLNQNLQSAISRS
ncbi:hypothetical protein [Desulfosporosinus nitroreducens]|uniref:hypothetical protein n=1 Tax=Desulfosporosinus nitroreducens TaxID=2018668 RepID=UPI00207D4FDC|nr:hypothetical protein [Desulfosporosinus nitroreducens]MCO1604625.1 hypothetical protein [Desulfosporosinus nitroreducens]